VPFQRASIHSYLQAAPTEIHWSRIKRYTPLVFSERSQPVPELPDIVKHVGPWWALGPVRGAEPPFNVRARRYGQERRLSIPV
jgi:hypothetical protein